MDLIRSLVQINILECSIISRVIYCLIGGSLLALEIAQGYPWAIVLIVANIVYWCAVNQRVSFAAYFSGARLLSPVIA